MEVTKSGAAAWMEQIARLGYAAKGMVYILVGLLAVQAVVGEGGAITDKVGALQVIVARPLGAVVVGILTLGLAAYVLWRFVQATLDPADHGRDAKGIAKRLSYAGNAVLYAGLTYGGLEILTGSPMQSSEDSAEDWTARALAWPYGPWLVAAVGGGIVAYGLYELYRAYTASFQEGLRTEAMSEQSEAWVTGIGRIGLIARSVVYGIIGIFLIQAGLQYNAERAAGLQDVLDTLGGGRLGPGCWARWGSG